MVAGRSSTAAVDQILAARRLHLAGGEDIIGCLSLSAEWIRQETDSQVRQAKIVDGDELTSGAVVVEAGADGYCTTLDWFYLVNDGGILT